MDSLNITVVFGMVILCLAMIGFHILGDDEQ